MNERYTFINNEFVTPANASLLINDLAVQRGYGIFDFLRISNDTPLFLADHLQRLFFSAEQMRLPLLYNKDDLKQIITTLIQKNKLGESGIRITLTGGYSADGYSIAQPNLIITQGPIQLPDATAFEEGIKLITYEHQRQLPYVKTIDYLMAIWLQPLIKEKGADDVLYFKNEIISECPRANIFIVTKEDEIITPKSNILKGITRNKIIDGASDNFSIKEKDISLSDVKQATEVFITSSTKKVLPITQVDDVVFNNRKPGKITREISKLFNALERNEIESFRKNQKPKYNSSHTV